ncbi:MULTISPECIES: hemerythrin domain-containing protein [unclassified Variovorax]|uniref:hemerythrin domain-containing protein n=1 Tax=unclassified Variovorax TaxID=663243 RepID=UPI001BD6C97E|nr:MULTISPECIES: hemerythrin domain-containing protein [unclassified Variovorax]
MSKAPPKKNDAVDFLDADHIAVKKLFQEFGKLAEAKAPAAKRKALADEICRSLTVHTTIEEEIFYPAARAEVHDEPMMDEATVEHASAKELIAQIEAMGADEPLFDAKVVVLGEQIDHHVKEEREEMFPKARASGMDLVELKEQLAARKQELMAQVEAAA